MNVNEWDFDDSRVAEFLAEQESQDIRRASEFKDDVLALFANNFETNGIKLPWSKTHSHVCLRDGEVSLWAGINGQ